MDPIVIHETLYKFKEKIDSILLILHSDGGSPDVAEKLVDILRDNARFFYVVIPERAKSAATLISLGANRIYMLENAELGPIDPQIKIGNHWRPAQSVIDGVQTILNLIGNQETLTPALVVLLQHIDPATLDFARKVIERTKAIAKKFLESYMRRSPEQAEKIAEKLADASVFLSHGKPIRWREAQELGLEVTRLPKDDKKYDLVWRYFTYALVYMGRHNKYKLVESPETCHPLPPDS